MFKIQDASFDKDTWFFITDAVKAFAEKSGIDVGTEVEIETEVRNGSKTIVKVKAKGGTTSSVETKSDTKEQSADVGVKTAEKTTYNSNYSSGKYGQRDPDTQESIIRQSVMKCAAEVVTACQGMVDPETVADTTIAIYRKLLAVVKE